MAKNTTDQNDGGNSGGNFNSLNTSKAATFSKGMIKDFNDSFVPEEVWINAINAVTNSHKGDAGTIGNEPSNLFCTQIPYGVIGIVRRDPDTWIIFSTNNVLSEIGLFTESTCTYEKVISDKCLNFKKANFITGYAQYNYDCTWSVFFADGLNPDRAINLDKPPYKIIGYDATTPSCPIPVYSDCLDCEATRLEYLINPPCYSIKKAPGAGSLLNGSYQAVLAYSINGQRVTSYFTPSNIMSMWDHTGVAGGLEITITNIDTRFEEYQLVLVSTVTSQTVARIIGNYSTTQSVVYIDNYSEALPSVELSLIPLVNPIYEKCDKMFMLNGYLLRSGIYSKFDFNYQPLANQIVTYWQEIEYPADYYYKGGVNTSYMRDEQYSFFIRWLYNDGDKSASYHIPGRPAFPGNTGGLPVSNADVLNPTQNKYWQVYNTSTVTNSSLNQILPDGGIVRAEGYMGYWESTERYPISPDVYNSNLPASGTFPYPNTGIDDYNLCGKAVRHHKMPDNSTSHIHNNGGDKIYLLGVRFDNIKVPVDTNNNPISSIIGFEILRGSREGNRTIIAKGLINNMREYSGPTGYTKKLLYQNYPYNDLNTDKLLSTKLFFNQGAKPDNDNNGLTGYRKDYFSFHSPETNFAKPFLSYDEVKIYTNEYGKMSGVFEFPYGQPKQKLITDASYLLGLTIGLGIALRAQWGAKKTDGPETIGNPAVYATQLSSLATAAAYSPLSLAAGGALAGSLPSTISSSAVFGFSNGFSTSITMPTTSQEPGDLTTLDFGGYIPGTAGQIVSKIYRIAMSLATISYYAGRGVDEVTGIIYELIPFRNYALQFDSHGFYNNYTPINSTTALGNTRRTNIKSTYTKGQLQTFDLTYDINNLYRNDYVTVNIKGTFPNPPGATDNSRVRVRDTQLKFNDPTNYYVTDPSGNQFNISSYYAALKLDYQNQYGQLEGIVQIPIQNCYTPIPYLDVTKIYSSPVLFGGDIYINRYTEKNPFFFFNQWLFNMPDGTAFDYSIYSNVLYPRYWANFDKFDHSAIQLPTWNDIISMDTDNILKWTKAASSYHHLDRGSVTNSFEVTNAWFYLFHNGVRDFFVESEVNLAFRDYGELISQRHYDYLNYTTISGDNGLFRTDIIKAGNYYKYDYSLSVSKLINQYTGFSTILPRDYDPQVAETCYRYYPRRVLYSLPQQSEQKRDSWRIYLPNNYKEFDNIINAMKPINRTGCIILFQDAEPTSVTGVDQLQTTQGVKITVGDGGLFQQAFQTLVNADDEYEYASCQDTRSVVNTPHGLFWVSRDTGKVFKYSGGGITDVSAEGMRYWFMEHLPNVLTTQFPGFTATENTLVGIGCQTVYDTQYELLYFSKKDFKAREGVFLNEATQEFYIEKQSGNVIVELGDPAYFEDCSWTISYDPKTKMWISFHDWHPDYVLGTNFHFFSIKNNAFWRHNVLCNSYCNYYGVDYPYEVEMPINLGSTVTTLKSVEYTLEGLNYSTDCIDPYHVLNANFDYAMIYNTEQNSGILNLHLKPYNPVEVIQYPKVQTNSIDILFSKEENKFRFNQFWDATRDRGEFSGNQFRMFNTEQNGYKKYLNPNYINYSKSPLERKKFRHYGNRIILGKYVSNNIKYNLKVVNAKETLSPR